MTYLENIRTEFHKAKKLADAAIRQVSDEDVFAVISAESNSIAVIMKHLAGNMLSRWTDFLTTDGEKPNRNRDSEFVIQASDTKQHLLEFWESGWTCLFRCVEPAHRGGSRQNRVHPRRAAHGDAGHQSPACALLLSRGANRFSGALFCGRELANVEHPQRQVRRIQSKKIAAIDFIVGRKQRRILQTSFPGF